MTTKNRAQIVPLYYSVEDVGKNIKQTKKKFNWKIQIDKKNYDFILYASMISGKVKLVCNDQVIAMSQQQAFGSFKHTMKLGNCQIDIIPLAGAYQMRVNEKSFIHMLNQVKTERQFVRNQQNYEDFVLDDKIARSLANSNGLKNTIKLKIGGMSAEKLKPAESDDWKNMIKDQVSQFPNIFETQNQESATHTADPSKVFMKKKQNQLFTLTNLSLTPTKQSSNSFFLTKQTAQQLKPQQQIFHTQINVQTSQNFLKQTNPSSINSQITPQNFSTMQLLFQTQCGIPIKIDQANEVQQVGKADYLKQLERVEQAEQVEQVEQVQQVQQVQQVDSNQNWQNFNTMQWMFNTMSEKPFPAFTVQMNTLPTIPKASLLLDALCSESKAEVPVTKNELINMSDFNTMQLMFATNNYKLGNNPTVQVKPDQINEPTISLPQPNTIDFITMADLFKTLNFSEPLPQLISQSAINQPENKPVNEFAAGSVNETVFEQINGSVNEQVTEPENTVLLNQSKNVNQNLNMNDFNTIQLLFKTNGIGISPNATTQKFYSQSKLKENELSYSFQQ